MADKNLDGNGLSEVWVRAAQLVKKYTGAVDPAKGDLQTQVNEKLSGTDDTKDNTVTFTSADESNPTAWKDVNVLSSKEKHLSLLNKISTMFSNVRYLYKILGTTDISALGTVTQAIATLNGNVGSIKGISSSAAITTQGQYALDAREKNASIDGTLANELSKVNSNLGKYIKRDGSTEGINLISDLNNFYTGISMFNENISNVPDIGLWLVIAAGDRGTNVQVAFQLGNFSIPKIRFCASYEWSDWTNIKLS